MADRIIYPEEVRAKLTPRQHEVLTLLAVGLTQAVIAQRLGVRLGTVRQHARAIDARLERHRERLRRRSPQ